MPDESLPQSQPPGSDGNDGPPRPQRVWLTSEEWSEISNCASALFAALQCFENRGDEVWDLVVSVHQRLQRALSPVEERLSDLFHSHSQ